MRDRLIEAIKNSLNKHIGKSCWLAENITNDLIADGWMRPPCKVGTTIYTIKDGEVKKQFVVEVSQHCNGNSYIKYVPYDKNGIPELNWVQKIYSDKAIGKIIFLSREEAEKALKGDEGK